MSTQPLLFGDPNAPLFGVYHPALKRVANPRGIVLCPPLGHEYLRTHRAFRQLAHALARDGHHVLRFDYRGTGDSAGDAEQFRWADWVADVQEAMQELRDSAGVSPLVLIGLRTGALLAVAAARAQPKDVTDLICWDPITSGASYLADLADVADRDLAGDGTIGAGGLALSSAMREDLRALDGSVLAPPPGSDALILGSEARSSWQALAEAWAAAGSPTTYQVEVSPSHWDEMDRIGAQLLPQPIIRAIVARLAPQAVTAHA